VSPGFIDTAICAGFGATKPPSEGTVSIVHCLFAPLEVTRGDERWREVARGDERWRELTRADER